MNRVLIIGAGGVANVTVRKCAALPDVFHEIVLASRTKEKCDRIAADLPRPIRTAAVDASDPKQVGDLIHAVKPRLVVHLALPYQDLAVMQACLEKGVDYLDTANYESPEEARFEYRQQWAFHEPYAEKGIMGLLGCGFDPGVTNLFIAYALKHHFDAIEEVDIMDCNAGSHGLPFATNFNPEINIREITQKGRYWENGQWKETEPLAVHKTFDFPEIGPREMYLMYHEELESLVRNIPGLKAIRFWMTFSESYLTHLRVLQNVGLTRIEPVLFEGRPIVPLQFLKALLPDPASLAPRYTGKTNIGCLIRGRKNGQPRTYYIYNVCDHAACYREVKAQAISYTTGVPAMIGSKLILEGVWRRPGVWNTEQLDPDPFLADLNRFGLPWQEKFL